MLLLALVAGFLSGSLPATGWAATDARLALEQRVETTKLQAMRMLAELATRDDALRHPPAGRVRLYVDQQVPGLLIEELRVLVDQREVAHYRYSSVEARALLGTGMQALVTLDLPPGEHMLVAEFNGRRDGIAASGEVVGAFTKGEQPLALVLPVAEREQAARIRVLDDDGASAADDDLPLRHARFLYDQGRYFSSLVALPGATEPATLDEARLWLVADAALAYGMIVHAQTALRELGHRGADPLRLGAAMQALADLALRRDDLAIASAAVRQATPGSEQRRLQGRILLAAGQYGAAAALLASDDDVYARFNHAVALIRSGRDAQGWRLLEQLGSQSARRSDERALREQASLLLGFHHLRRRDGAAAQSAFGRIRLQGPHSNRALLGLGWAELTGSAAGDEPAALHRALRPWRELAQRDPMDAAVQEGLLAIAHALDLLGDHEQALHAYIRAIEVLETGRARIAAGIRSVNDARMLQTILRRDAGIESGDRWRLLDLPDLPETWWLHGLLAEHRVQEQIKNFRDLRLVVQRLDEVEQRAGDLLRAPPERPGPMPAQWRLDEAPAQPLRLRLADRLQPAPGATPVALVSPPVALRSDAGPAATAYGGAREALAAALREMVAFRLHVEALADLQSAAVRELTAGELAAQQATLDTYLAQARFAVARIYDQQLRGAGLPRAEAP